MTITATRPGHVLNPCALFIGGTWVEPSSSSTFEVMVFAAEPGGSK